MTKTDLVEQVADVIGPGVSKRDCKLVVDGLLAAVTEALARGEGVELRGLGTLKIRHRKARRARNPRTGQPVEVPARAVAVFRPSRHFSSVAGSHEGIAPPWSVHPQSSPQVRTCRLETIPRLEAWRPGVRWEVGEARWPRVVEIKIEASYARSHLLVRRREVNGGVEKVRVPRQHVRRAGNHLGCPAMARSTPPHTGQGPAYSFPTFLSRIPRAAQALTHWSTVRSPIV